MRTTTRHQLKQDKFAVTAVETYSWAVEHRDKIIYGGIAVAAVLVLLIGGWTYLGRREQSASKALGDAMTVYNAPVRPANVPADPAIKSFASSEERARAAHAEFEKVASEYSHSKSADVATYLAAITAKDLNDMSGAESGLKKVADSGNEDLSSFAKLALANLYRETNRDGQAIELYKQLIDHPTRAVGKSAAQLQLAQLYQAKQPQEAAKLYEQIRKEDPQSVAAEIAAQNTGANR